MTQFRIGAGAALASVMTLLLLTASAHAAAKDY